MKRRQLRAQPKLTLGNVYDLLASLMLLVPCGILLALENKVPGVTSLWWVLVFCSGLYLCALAVNRIKGNAFTLGGFLLKNGGFVLLFGMVLYRALTI